MKKIGIITLQGCNNYGADLQAYALQAALRHMGYDAENINYYFYKNRHHRATKASLPIFKLSFKNRLKEMLFPVLIRILEWIHHDVLTQAHQRREEVFEKFVRENMRQSRGFVTYDELVAHPPEYDVYMVGSDQVWNPRMASTLKPYLLDFVPRGKRLVSYASSFGIGRLPGAYVPAYRHYLERFSSVGVRELSGVRIVERQLGLKAECVADPTLLLSPQQWRKIARQPEELAGVTDYLLVYDLLPSPAIWKLAGELASCFNLKIVQLCASSGMEYGAGVLSIPCAGPAEFVAAFAGAKAVITSSLHGTAFSLIFQKPFYSVLPVGVPNKTRVESLLNKAGCPERLVRARAIEGLKPNLDLNWPVIQTNLDVWRQESIEYLSHAVEGLPTRKGPRFTDIRMLGDACCGCGACSIACPAKCIVMRADVDGFRKPVIDSSRCLHCGTCLVTCGMANPMKRSEPLECLAAWHTDKAIRAAGTSGSVFTALAQDTFSRGGVVYGAAFDKDFNVHHVAAQNLEELAPLRGSKYLPSETTAAFASIQQNLKDGQEVLFCGTPCQVSSLRRLAGDNPKLTTVDLVCHGVPSPVVFQKYVRQVEAQSGSRLVGYAFRDKGILGWNFPLIRFDFGNDKRYFRIAGGDPFLTGFYRNMTLRESCHCCPFVGSRRAGDISLGDCWRIAAAHPDYDDNRGTSLVLVNSSKGQETIGKLRAVGCLITHPCELSFAVQHNEPLAHSSVRPVNKDEFLNHCHSGHLLEALSGLVPWYWRLRSCVSFGVKRIGWGLYRRFQ